MSQIILRGQAFERRKAKGHWFLVLFGMLAIVFPVVCLKTDAPDEIQRLAPFIAFGGIVLVLIGIWVYFSVRGHFFVTKGQSEKYGFTIVDSRRRKVIEIFTPFSFKCYSDLQQDGKFMTYFLYMIINDRTDQPVLQLEARYPAIMGQPEGWTTLAAGDLDGIDVPRYMTNSLVDLRKLFVKVERASKVIHTKL